MLLTERVNLKDGSDRVLWWIVISKSQVIIIYDMIMCTPCVLFYAPLVVARLCNRFQNSTDL